MKKGYAHFETCFVDLLHILQVFLQIPPPPPPLQVILIAGTAKCGLGMMRIISVYLIGATVLLGFLLAGKV